MARSELLLLRFFTPELGLTGTLCEYSYIVCENDPSYPDILHSYRHMSACPLPVYSPRINLDMMTVKIGAELLTVSAKDTATFFRLTKPRTTVVNLTNGDKEDINI